MTEQVLDDDVFALFARFDLDWTNYRVFPKSEEAQTNDKDKSDAGVAVAEPAGPPSLMDVPPVVEIEQKTISPVPAPRAAVTAPDHHWARYPSQPTEDFSEIDHGRIALQNLLRRTGPSSLMPGPTTARSLAAVSVSIHGAAGGVGTTTIAAMLTRLLARSGRRCGILDETGDSTLPIFFGAQRVVEDHRRFCGLHALLDSRVQILNPEKLSTSHPAAAPGLSFIERNFIETANDFDHLIVDHRARNADTMGAGITLYVTIPDLSSLAGLRKLMRIMDQAGDRDQTICVLNRFDSRSVLHQELLGWYRENFRNLAVIRDSGLIPEALAEGTTVVDWAADAAVSSDFLALFGTVSVMLTPKTREF